MSGVHRSGGRRFQAGLYRDMDDKLRRSQWHSGASEAHGLLCGLACRGVREEQVRGYARLLRLNKEDELELIDGMYAIIRRELCADGFDFNLLLPDTMSSRAQRVEAMSDWCDGFLQGFLHDADEDGNAAGNEFARWPETVREAVRDVLTISRVGGDAGVGASGNGEEVDKQLAEIEEFLRVATQVIFDAIAKTSNNQQTRS